MSDGAFKHATAVSEMRIQFNKLSFLEKRVKQLMNSAFHDIDNKN